METGIHLIEKKQAKARSKGRTVELDALHNWQYQLSTAAAALLYDNGNEPGVVEALIDLTAPRLFGWDVDLFSEMMRKPYADRLEIAGSLIASELDRLIFVNFKGVIR